MPLAALVSNLAQKAMREHPLERQRPVFKVPVMATRIPGANWALMLRLATALLKPWPTVISWFVLTPLTMTAFALFE